MRVARPVELDPGAAYELWTDLSRWPAFVDGFGHVDRVDDDWPAAGTKLVWRSVPSGRGVVTERVKESVTAERVISEVLEERTIGTQTVEFAKPPEGDAGAIVAIELDYTLQQRGPLNRIVDLLFIRRAQRDALTRTLVRFGREAAEEAAM